MHSKPVEHSKTWQELSSWCEKMLLSLPPDHLKDCSHKPISVQPTLQLDLPLGRPYRHIIQKALSRPLEENALARCSSLLERADEELRQHVVGVYWANVRETRSMERSSGVKDTVLQQALAEAYTSFYTRSEERLVKDTIATIESRASIQLSSLYQGVNPNVYEETLMAAFQVQRKPSTSEKQALADHLGVPLAKVSNWFQNRRSRKVKPLRGSRTATQSTQRPPPTTASQHEITTIDLLGTSVATIAHHPAPSPLQEIRAREDNSEPATRSLKRGGSSASQPCVLSDGQSGLLSTSASHDGELAEARVVRGMPKRKVVQRQHLGVAAGQEVFGGGMVDSPMEIAGPFAANGYFPPSVGGGWQSRQPNSNSLFVPSPTPSLSRSVSGTSTSTASSSTPSFTSDKYNAFAQPQIPIDASQIAIPPRFLVDGSNDQFLDFSIPPPSFDLGAGIINGLEQTWNSDAFIKELLESCLPAAAMSEPVIGAPESTGSSPNWWEQPQQHVDPSTVLEMEELLQTSPFAEYEGQDGVDGYLEVEHTVSAGVVGEENLQWFSELPFNGAFDSAPPVDSAEGHTDAAVGRSTATSDAQITTESFLREWYPDLLLPVQPSNDSSPVLSSATPAASTTPPITDWSSGWQSGVLPFDSGEASVMGGDTGYLVMDWDVVGDCAGLQDMGQAV